MHFSMQTITYKITDPRGIHARPAGQLVKLISGYKSSCKMGKADQLIDGKRLLPVFRGYKCQQTAYICCLGVLFVPRVVGK